MPTERHWGEEYDALGASGQLSRGLFVPRPGVRVIEGQRMFRLLLPVFLVLGLFFYWKKLKDLSAEERSRRLKGIASIAAMLVAAAFAARAGSWGWAFGGLLAIVALRAIPYLMQRTQPGAGSDGKGEQGTSTTRGRRMTHDDALRVLDLTEPLTMQSVQTRYREVMRGVHPDRGGSTHLAAQVNEAYEVLLDHVSAQKRA
jgi:hypothetical protein